MAFHRIRLSLLALTLFAVSACLPVARLSAQSTTQGAISGTVEDPSGAVVGGASVMIRNAGTNATFQVTADGSGYFNAPLLEPGTYTVTVSAQGFAGYRADNVIVVVGQVTSVLPHLALSSSTTEVVVNEQTPVMNLESPDFTDTLNTQALQSIPINNRRWSSLAMTTPGVVSDGNGFGLVSIRGVSPILNNVEIDGADDNSAFWAEERGRTREAYSTSGNEVREFAVNTGVYSAEFGRAAGGVLTSVTKSGTNQMHGEAYFFDRESNWNAYNDWTKITTLSNGAITTSVIKPEDLRKIYGFTAGGALIKDKLFWMYTYDQHTHVFPVIGTPDNATNFYTLPQATLSAGETCNLATQSGFLTGAPASAINDINACTLAARQHISYTQAAYDWAALVFGSSAANVSNYPGAAAISDLGLNSDLGQVSRFGYQEINTPKLDWQINPKEHWSALFHRLRWDSPGGVQTAAADQYARDTQGNDFVKLDYGLTKLTTLVSNNISNEVLFQYGRELEDENQQALTAYTEADLRASALDTPQVGVAASNAGFNAGSPYYSYRVADPYETKWQIGDVLYWNKGNHTLKLGVDLLHNYDLVVNTYQSNGAYSFTYLGNYMNDELNFKNGVIPSAANDMGCNSSASQNATSSKGAYQNVNGTDPCFSTFFEGFGNPAFAVATMDSGVFAQDNWKFSPRLTLELGLRWDHEGIPGAVSNLTTAVGAFNPYTGISNNPSDKADFGPRVGFSYDLFGRGNTVLRGGYGLYYGRITNGNIEEVRLNTGSPNGQIDPEWKTTTAAAPVFPNVFTTGGAPACSAGSTACPTSYYFAPNLKLPEVQEFDFQVQQSLGKGNFLSLSYLGSLGRRLPNFLDVNLTGLTNETLTVSDATNSGPLGANGATIAVPTYTAYGNTALLGPNAAFFSTITEMASNVNSQYNAAVVEVGNRSLKNLQFDANYTWSHALDFSQNADTAGAANAWYDPFNNARINYGNSSYDIPNRFVGYVLYTLPGIHSGSLVKYVTNGWSINDSFQMQNGLPYTAGVSSFTTYGIGNYLNGSSGNNVIPQIGVNTFRYPRHEVDDVRLQKDIPFEAWNHSYTVQLLANAFNVANHQNVTSYASTALYQLSGTSVIYNKQPGTTDDTFGVVNNSNSSGFLYTPREIEISARLTW
jgi:outer membrane receptor protein involved in Fe transport